MCCKQSEKLITLVVVVDEIVTDNFKNLAVPNLGQAQQNLKRIENAIAFEETEVEAKIEAYDLGHLADAEEDLPEVMPGKY